MADAGLGSPSAHMHLLTASVLTPSRPCDMRSREPYWYACVGESTGHGPAGA